MHWNIRREVWQAIFQSTRDPRSSIMQSATSLDPCNTSLILYHCTLDTSHLYLHVWSTDIYICTFVMLIRRAYMSVVHSSIYQTVHTLTWLFFHCTAEYANSQVETTCRMIIFYQISSSLKQILPLVIHDVYNWLIKTLPVIVCENNVIRTSKTWIHNAIFIHSIVHTFFRCYSPTTCDMFLYCSAQLQGPSHQNVSWYSQIKYCPFLEWKFETKVSRFEEVRGELFFQICIE